MQRILHPSLCIIFLQNRRVYTTIWYYRVSPYSSNIKFRRQYLWYWRLNLTQIATTLLTKIVSWHGRNGPRCQKLTPVLISIYLDALVLNKSVCVQKYAMYIGVYHSSAKICQKRWENLPKMKQNSEQLKWKMVRNEGTKLPNLTQNSHDFGDKNLSYTGR